MTENPTPTKAGAILARYRHHAKTEFPASAILLSEATKSGRIYLLVEGTVEVLRGGVQVAVVNEPGSFFGEMSVLLDTPHTATVRALTPVTVHEFANAAEFLKSDPAIILAIARLLAQRLNSATMYLADLKRQYAGHANHLGMVSDVLASLINQPPGDFEPGSDRHPDPTI